MPVMRLLLAAACALLAMAAWAQRAMPPSPGCPQKPADCTASLPVFDFGRHAMDASTRPIDGRDTVSVTCTRSPQANGRQVDVSFTLKAEPADPRRTMRTRDGGLLKYALYLDPARTHHWGDGFQFGTFTIQGVLSLTDRNQVGTLAFVVYGTVEGNQVLLPGPALGGVINRLEYTINCR